MAESSWRRRAAKREAGRRDAPELVPALKHARAEVEAVPRLLGELDDEVTVLGRDGVRIVCRTSISPAVSLMLIEKSVRRGGGTYTTRDRCEGGKKGELWDGRVEVQGGRRERDVPSTPLQVSRVIRR